MPNLFLLCRSSGWRFQQDGASVHRALTTQAYLTHHRVRLLNRGFWPPMSPDLNPIEHLWPMVLHRMKGSVFSGREQLWTSLQEHFAAITPGQVKALYDSMPDRLTQALAQRGGPTRYQQWVARTKSGTVRCRQCPNSFLSCALPVALPLVHTSLPEEQQWKKKSRGDIVIQFHLGVMIFNLPTMQCSVVGFPPGKTHRRVVP